MLALLERYKSDECHTEVLHTLLRYGADARAPALYEVTQHLAGEVISSMQHMLCAASGQSLMAFHMSMRLDVPPQFNFITDGLAWLCQAGQCGIIVFSLSTIVNTFLTQ